MSVAFASAAEIRLGRQRAPQYETGAHQTPYLRSANINDGVLDLTDVKSMNFTPGEQAVFALRPGDVLITEGSGSRATVGASTVWGDELEGTVCFQNTLLRLRPRAGVSDGRYLAWWARHAHSSGLMAAVASGANILHLGAENLRRLPITLPSLDEQRRIADFLDDQVTRVDAAILVRQMQRHLVAERLQTALDDHVDALADVRGWIALRRLALGIEQGWSPSCESRAAESGEAGVLKLGAVRHGAFIPSENKAFALDVMPIPELRVEAGDLLVSRANTPALVGEAAVVADVGNRDLYLCDLLYRVRLTNATVGEFVSATLGTTRARDTCRVVARGTSDSMVKLRGEDILNLAMPVCTLEQMRDLGELHRRTLSARDDSATEFRQSVELLQERKRALITAAVTGEFDVTTARTRAADAVLA